MKVETEMTSKDIIITYLSNGKEKKISLAHVDRKYFPPREPRVSVPETPAYYTYLINYVSNRLTEEFNAKFEAKKREEELKLMEEREKKYREESERRRQTAVNRGAYQLQTFASRGYVCPFCYSSMHTLTCSKTCQAPNRVDMSDAMKEASKILKENEQLKERIAQLEQQLQVQVQQ